MCSEQIQIKYCLVSVILSSSNIPINNKISTDNNTYIHIKLYIHNCIGFTFILNTVIFHCKDFFSSIYNIYIPAFINKIGFK